LYLVACLVEGAYCPGQLQVNCPILLACKEADVEIFLSPSHGSSFPHTFLMPENSALQREPNTGGHFECSRPLLPHLHCVQAGAAIKVQAIGASCPKKKSGARMCLIYLRVRPHNTKKEEH